MLLFVVISIFKASRLSSPKR